MENAAQQIEVIDPWHGKTGKLSFILLASLFIFFLFAVYDSATFYAHFKQNCAQQPNKVECKNFLGPVNVPSKPALNVLVDYGRGKYAIQTGAYKNEENAKSAASQLQSYGIQYRITKTKVKGSVLYRVQLGRFPEKKIATQTALELKAKNIISDFTVVDYNKNK